MRKSVVIGCYVVALLALVWPAPPPFLGPWLQVAGAGAAVAGVLVHLLRHPLAARFATFARFCTRGRLRQYSRCAVDITICGGACVAAANLVAACTVTIALIAAYARPSHP